ncbi:hypothetical protein [Nitrosomonas sp. Nm58]|uniref:hypothetical protein n=1 Tax=Nitrosomonas sp. Nm58 TaxID=200126 RepID=UPI0008965F15|nr:hypothetical protein [Nitrosomonas sp. Nm58]SDY88897.1 hypothetical protein SAMN05421754_102815 [Nitrosomonas sp. Nm58]
MARTFLRFVGKLWENGEFEPGIGWETERIRRRPNPDPYHQLQIIDKMGNVLAAGSVELRTPLCRSRGTDGMIGAKVVGYVALHPEGYAVVFRCGERILYRVELKPERPAITRITVKVDEDYRIHANWEAEHSQPLWFNLIFIDSDRRAISIGHELSEKQLVIETNHLPGGPNCTLAILATDGVRSTTMLSDPFSLPEKPPQLLIITPGGGEVLNPDQPISLLGNAHDLAGRTLSDEHLIWMVDGEVFAQGKRLVPLGPLVPGPHRIKLAYQPPNSDITVQTEVTVNVSNRSPEQEEWLKISRSFFDIGKHNVEGSTNDQNHVDLELDCERK